MLIGLIAEKRRYFNRLQPSEGCVSRCATRRSMDLGAGS